VTLPVRAPVGAGTITKERGRASASAVVDLVSDDATFVDRVRAGDRAAFGAVFSTYAASLYSYAHRFTRSRATAEELVHDVFIRVWETRAEWRARSIGAYLHVAVRRRALNYVRHQTAEQAWRRATHADQVAEVRVVAETPESRVLANDLATAATRALDKLTPGCREAIVLHRQHGLSCAEIAAVLGVTPKAVEHQVGRALKALRALLAAYLVLTVAIRL
jgi:RNA polymerase sigma-70 factor (family 1)